MKLAHYLLVLLSYLMFTNSATAHGEHQQAQGQQITESSLGAKVIYLANEGVFLQSGNTKLLFDPFFHNSFGHYTLLPTDIRRAIFENKPPYNNIDIVLISHAHEDHFDAQDVLNYMLAQTQVRLVAPSQAVALLKPYKLFDKIKSRITEIKLVKDQLALTLNLNQVSVEAIRIPHAGWPQRAEVENIVYRVTANNDAAVMHLGDADPNPRHFIPHMDFFEKQITHLAFLPYWFEINESGRQIIQKALNAKQVISIHVPTQVPDALKQSGADYFSVPGESRQIEAQ